MLRLRPPASLRTRLALWYMLIVGLTMICFGAVVIRAVSEYVTNAQDTTLQERATLLATLVRMDASGIRFTRNTSFPIERGTAAYLFDARGRLVDRVAGLQAVLPQTGVSRVLATGRSGWVTNGNVRAYISPCATPTDRCVGCYRSRSPWT